MIENKIVVLDFTGASFDFLYPLIKKGELVNLEKILTKGAGGSIKAGFPLLHSVSFASFFTGKASGSHGIYDSTRGGKAAPVTLDDIDTDTLLDILERNDKKSVFINVPISNVTKYNHATIIKRLPPSCSKSGKEEFFVSPDCMKAELKKGLGGYAVYVEKDFDSRRLQRIVSALYDSIEVQTDAVLYMLKHKEYDLLVASYNEIDKLEHLLLSFSDTSHPEYNEERAKKFKNTVHEFYKKLDEKLGHILKAIDKNTTLMIFSDFGVAPIRKFVDINVWLRENGYLKIKDSSLDKVNKSLFFDTSSKTKELAKFHLNHLKGESELKRRYDALCRLFVTKDDIDWSRTKAFSAGSYGQIFINLTDKYPHGAVSGNDYDGILNEMAKKLMNLKDPETDRKFINEVIKKRNLGGDMTKNASDLFIIPDNLSYYPFASLHEENISLYQCAFTTFTSHKTNGLVMASGAQIKRGSTINYAQIMDFVPTILYLFGIDIPSDIDGKVIKEAIKESCLKKKKVLHTLKTKEPKTLVWGQLNPINAGT